jgi:hypothetical protein
MSHRNMNEPFENKEPYIKPDPDLEGLLNGLAYSEALGPLFEDYRQLKEPLEYVDKSDYAFSAVPTTDEWPSQNGLPAGFSEVLLEPQQPYAGEGMLCARVLDELHELRQAVLSLRQQYDELAKDVPRMQDQ